MSTYCSTFYVTYCLCVVASSTIQEILVSQSQSIAGDSADGQASEFHFVGRLQEIRAPEKKVKNISTWMHRGEIAFDGRVYTTTYRTFQEHRLPLPSGKAGDIWLDLTNRQIFYCEDIWKQWPGNAYPARHPFFAEYKLYWSPVHQDVAWRSYSTISRLNKRHPNLKDITALEILELLAADSLTIRSSSEPNREDLKRKSISEDIPSEYEDDGRSNPFGMFSSKT